MALKLTTGVSILTKPFDTATAFHCLAGHVAELKLIVKMEEGISLDHRFRYLLSDPSDFNTVSYTQNIEEATALKLMTGKYILAEILQYKMEYHQESFGHHNYTQLGIKSLTVDVCARIYREHNNPVVYLYPGIVPCYVQSISWDDYPRI